MFYGCHLSLKVSKGFTVMTLSTGSDRHGKNVLTWILTGYDKAVFSEGTVVNISTCKCLFQTLKYAFEPPHDKTNKMNVHPAKTQIRLGIRPVWSESSLCSQWVDKIQAFFMIAKTQIRLADAQAYLSLRWAHMPFCWFCHEAARMYC